MEYGQTLEQKTDVPCGRSEEERGRESAFPPRFPEKRFRTLRDSAGIGADYTRNHFQESCLAAAVAAY